MLLEQKSNIKIGYIIFLASIFILLSFSLKNVIALDSISFVAPTPQNSTSTTDTNAEINVSITNASNLDTFIWNWNNVNYTFYNKSLVLMFNFDNVSALGENATYAVDVSKYGNNGTLHNGTVWNCAGGRYGCALSFDGVDDYVQINDSNSFNLITHFTLEAWINPRGLMDDPAQGGIISKVGGGGAGSYQLLITKNNTLVACQFNGGGGNWTTDSLLASKNIPVNIWTHIACIYNNSILSIYVDGVLINSLNVGAKNISNSNSTLRISSDDNNNVFFNGSIDEVRIWNRSLSASEIQQQYYSNFYKYATDKWAFYTNQANLATGIYTYWGYVRDAIGSLNQTETRTLTITSILEIASSTSRKCTNECSFGERKCAGDNSYRLCGDYDLDSCRDWSDAKYCAENRLCSNGECKINCEENWICDSWSACENGEKRRACKDLNNCGTSASKPDESLDCLGKAGLSGALPAGSLLLFLTTGIIILAAIIFIVQFNKNIKTKRKRKAMAYRRI